MSETVKNTEKNTVKNYEKFTEYLADLVEKYGQDALLETVGSREDGAFFDLTYYKKDNSITISFFDNCHFVQDVVIELDK